MLVVERPGVLVKTLHMRRIGLFGILAVFPLLLLAQHPVPKCLTPPGISPWLAHFQQHPEKYPTLRSTTGWMVPVTTHITLGQDGERAIPVAQMLDAFCQLNQDFKPTGIQFYIDQIRYIDRADYYDHTRIEQAIDMMTTENLPGTVNVYFVNTAVVEDACGYNLVDQNRESLGMTLAGSCTRGSNSNWAHEMGHYFSLPHTFNGWEGILHDYRLPAPEFVNNVPVERADQSNCAVSGDGFCDTPPDYLNGRWYCAEDGNSSFIQRDPENRAFRSDGSMIMSYAFDGCADRFSPRQIMAMQNYLVSRRANHLTPPPDQPGIRGVDVQLNFPLSGEALSNNQLVQFDWEPVDGALGYILEVSMLPTFSVLHAQEFVFTAGHNLRNLPTNRTYYWRVRVFSRRNTCPSYSEVHSFDLRPLTTSTQSLPAVTSFQVQPNPITAGQHWTVQLRVQATTMVTAEIRSMQGQQLHQQVYTLNRGRQMLTVPSAGIPAGMYWLRLHNSDGQVTRKVIVQ